MPVQLYRFHSRFERVFLYAPRIVPCSLTSSETARPSGVPASRHITTARRTTRHRLAGREPDQEVFVRMTRTCSISIVIVRPSEESVPTHGPPFPSWLSG